ncbi:MAG: zinc metalloprotease HtpX, partial [Gammaproteobacteria bacterium]|nr:zinc metalloprotease HtpX [Gammaproteobacteria bacterium]
MNRIFLFLLTNIAILAVFSVTMRLLGVESLLDAQGVNL